MDNVLLKLIESSKRRESLSRSQRNILSAKEPSQNDLRFARLTVM